jgi:uncharacterized membrane protein
MKDYRIGELEISSDDGSEMRETLRADYEQGIPQSDEMVAGAVAGGVIGAVTGGVVGGPVAAVIGGAIGAATGATAGAIDQQGKDEPAVVARVERHP